MHECSFGSRRWSGLRRFRFALLLAVAVLLVVAGWVALRPRLSDAYVAPVVRLHVVPNSDSAADQQLKLSVRDALLPVVDRLLQADGDAGDAAVRLAAHGRKLRNTALTELRRLHSDYPVTIMTDVNGDGEPLAVRVVIGAGLGSNWFCVLVPPLCFADLEPVERAPVDEDDSPSQGGLRIAWKWFGKWFGGSGVPIEGVGDMDQDDVHADLAHAVPGDGDIRSAAE